MNVIGPFPLYAILNPICWQILHVRSIWNSFKIFTVSWSAEEIANETLKQILSRFSVLPLKPFCIPWCIILFTHDLTRSHLHSTWVTHVAWRRKGRGMFVPKSSGEQFFTVAINTPFPFLTSFTPLDRSLSRSSFSNPSAAATPSSPVRKSFTALTSSPPYSHRPRKSSLRRSCSRLPPLS